MRWKTCKFNMNLWDQSDENKPMGEENWNREPLEPGEVCGVPVHNKLLTLEDRDKKFES